MRRWGRFAVGFTAVALLAMGGGSGASASGGGGCGRPVTDARSDTVVIRDYCFGPTIAHVPSGTVVTFVNKDGFPHTVVGANGSWGTFRMLDARDILRYRFTQPGVYPFVCTFHVGMVGAVVVGPGVPSTPEETTTAAGPVVSVPLRPVTTTAVQETVPATVATPGESPVAGIAAVAIGALALSLGFVWASRVRRRRTLPA